MGLCWRCWAAEELGSCFAQMTHPSCTAAKDGPPDKDAKVNLGIIFVSMRRFC